MKSDMKKSLDVIKQLNLKYMLANQKNLGDVTKSLDTLLAIANEIEVVANKLQSSGFKDAALALQSLVDQVTKLPADLQAIQVKSDKTPEVVASVKELTTVVRGQKLDPKINVNAPAIDLAPLLKAMSGIKDAVSQDKNAVDTSKLESLTQSVATAVDGVKKAVNALRFPVPNYVLPFQTNVGKDTQVVLDAAGNIPVTGTLSVTPSGTQNVNLLQVAGASVATGHGTASGAIRVELPTDGTGLVSAAQSGTWNITNVSGTVSLPTGASTSALQTTGNTSLSSIDTKLPSGLTVTSTRLLVDGSGVTQPVSGTITANAGTGNFSIIGTKTNNNAAPGATNIGALVGIANAVAPTYTEGDQVLLSTDLTGTLRVNATVSGGSGTSLNDNSAFTANTTPGTPAMGFYHSTIDTVTDGRAAAIAIDSKRNLFNVIRDAAGNARGANVTSSNELLVNINNTSLAVTNTGTFAVQATLTAETTKVIGTVNQGTSPWAVSLAAETTKVIGVVRIADGAGNLLTSSTAEPAAGDRGLEVREAGTGFVSTNNSSTATLAANAVFTGTADTATNYASATVYVYSDQPSATNGLSIQQSSDGTNWDISDTYTIPATTGKTFGVQITAANLRIVYTNGTTAQGSFRLQVLLHKYMHNTSSIRPQDSRGNDNDMQEVVAYGSHYDSNNNVWNRARGSTANGLQVDVTRIQGSVSDSIDQVGQSPVVTSAPGVQQVTVAGPFGEALDTTGNTLNVAVTKGAFPTGTQTYFNSALSNTLSVAKVGAGVLTGIELQNPNTTNAYVQVFDALLGTVTVGTTTPKMSFIVPASGANDKPLINIPYSSGLLVVATTTATGSTAPTSGLVVNLW